jgi:hypothetical protein
MVSAAPKHNVIEMRRNQLLWRWQMADGQEARLLRSTRPDWVYSGC